MSSNVEGLLLFAKIEIWVSPGKSSREALCFIYNKQAIHFIGGYGAAGVEDWGQLRGGA